MAIQTCTGAGAAMLTPRAIVAYWREAGPQRWFARDAEFDDDFRARSMDAHFAAARGEYAHWLDHAEGALALLILLDQFPRNCFRDSAHAYATDGLARYYAGLAIEAGHDRAFPKMLRAFFYLPFEHSEDAADQERSVRLFAALDDADYDRYAALHRDLIIRFGRFPHRNAALGRVSTREELEYLDSGGFAG